MPLKLKPRPKTKPATKRAPPPRVRSVAISEKPVGYIAILTDASGSMEGKVNDTITAFNRYIAETTTAMKDKPVTLKVYQFSGTNNWAFRLHGSARELYSGMLNGGFRLSRENYNCSGGTPLIDACCDVIDRAKDDWSVRKIIVIQTDGEENQSTRFNKDDLRQRIAKAQEAGWQIIFLGVGIDGFAEASKYGVHSYGTVSVDSHNTHRTMVMTAAKSANYFGTGQAVAFTTAERGILREAALTGSSASASAGAAADALEINVKVTKPKAKG